jgi:DNA-directed RNA polymerase specialized sigma24 family protein
VTDRTDADLIHAAESDPVAFAELYRRHVSTVHGWFRRRLEWAASDLTAETFAQAWLSRRCFRDEADGSALPWLLGIARNVARESARRNEVETRARRRLGLPIDLASEDGFAARSGSRRASGSPRHSRSCRSTSGRLSSFAWSASCRTRTSPPGWASVPRPRDCASRERSGASPPCP